ncbi:hypothetical protein [Pseudoalteromonas sp. ZZD1]|uniref:hypothetical protein n=1 Tax=Pseudoalteromonas sp. ZZD1 TaxID=3139395 RepID=UPI003BA85BAB
MQLLMLIGFMLMLVPNAIAQQVTVRYSAGGHPYAIELLQLALSKSDITINMQPVDNIPSQTRAIRLLGTEKGIDVVWKVTNSESEKKAKAILIPIVKGLLGYRIPLVHINNKELFRGVRHSRELQRFIFGLREDWPDAAIFQSNELKITTYGQGADPLHMLVTGRFDALPYEIFEVTKARHKSLVNDQNIAIHYPSAVYFFVANDNMQLHGQIHKGLELAIADGSFDELFYRHFADAIAQANLKNRRIIELKNPLLPLSAPLNSEHYWLDVKELNQ